MAGAWLDIAFGILVFAASGLATYLLVRVLCGSKQSGNRQDLD